MKLLNAILIVLTSVATWASDNSEPKFLFKSDDAPRAFRYLAVFALDSGNSFRQSGSQYIVTFGEGAKFKAYNVGSYLYISPGIEFRANEEDTILIAKPLSQAELVVVAKDRRSNKVIYTAHYRRHHSLDSVSYAKNINRYAHAEFAKYRTLSHAKNIRELRRIFWQISLDFGYRADSAYGDFPFPTFELQIEWDGQSTEPDRTLAKAKIRADRKDPISKKFLPKKSVWHADIDVARASLIELIENNVDLEDGPAFLSYSPKSVFEGLSPRLQKALAPHLKYEILEVQGWDCEGNAYTWVSATWLLRDGSTLSYSPGTECD